MPANLTDNYVANTYKGVLHVNGEELPADAKVQVYDGAGNETAIKLGSNAVDCLSLSAHGLTANDFKYPEETSGIYSVMCQTSTVAKGGVNILELKPIQEIFCESKTGVSSYVRESESVVPIVTVECGIVKGVEDKEVVAITTAAGGITTNQSGNFTIAAANIEGGIVKGLSLTPASLAPTPNLLINAQGIINQRQINSGADLDYDWNPKKYFLDRWKSNGGSSVTWSYDIPNIATITAGLAGISQTIERANIIPGNYTLSWIGNAIATVQENNDDKVTGTGGSGSVKQLSVNLVGDGNVQITFTNGTFSLPKFERGIRTEFDYRDFGTELLLCQRYFNKTYSYDVRPGRQSTDGRIIAHTTEPITPTFHNAGWRYQTTMRVKPQAWPFSPNNGAINRFVYFENNRVNDRPARVSNWSDSGISTIENRGSGLAGEKQRVVSVHYVVDAEF